MFVLEACSLHFLESKIVPNVVRFAGLILIGGMRFSELNKVLYYILAPLYSIVGFVNLAERKSR